MLVRVYFKSNRRQRDGKQRQSFGYSLNELKHGDKGVLKFEGKWSECVVSIEKAKKAQLGYIFAPMNSILKEEKQERHLG